MMIKKIIGTWKNQRNEYFSVGNDDIAKGNLVMLFQASMVTAIMTVCLILITPCIIAGWKPTIQHLLLVPVSAGMGLGALWYKKQAEKSATVVSMLCYSFIAVILTFIIAIDTLQSGDKPSSFMQVMLVAIPALFTLRFRYLYTELLLFEVIYIVITFQHKIISMAQCDLFNSIVGMIFSVIVASIIQRLRADAYLLQNQYKKLSMTDGLTGIMNKSNCELAIHEYLEKRMPEDNCALMILDVDNFKMVNDTLGHKTGDDILGSVGEILSHLFRGTDILGRFGGDEFLVVMCHLPGTDIVSKKCDMIAAEMKELSHNYPCTITCSIGVACLSGPGMSYEKLFQIADSALYEAKASGKSCYVMHEIDERNNAGDDKSLIDRKVLY